LLGCDAPHAEGAAERSFDAIRLSNLAAKSGRLFGCAVEPHHLRSDPDYRALVERHCALLIPENAMKWDALRPGPSRFDFARADDLVAIARETELPLHGHCLVWHEALPDWARRDLEAGRGARLLAEHVGAVCRRYAGAMRSWDVINEPVERNDHRSDGLRRSPWLENLGPGYLSQALHLAHEADPGARLAISDYGLEYDHVTWMVEKRGEMLKLLSGLKAVGAPLHALSIQGHLLAHEPTSFGLGLTDFLRAVADLGLGVYVTELDVNEQKLTGSAAARDRITADCYARFLDAILSVPEVEVICTWGLADRYTSKREMFPHADGAEVRPLPFDARLAAKPAAWALADAFQIADPEHR
jgi:endo-1,4-beta-xylanase